VKVSSFCRNFIAETNLAHSIRKEYIHPHFFGVWNSCTPTAPQYTRARDKAGPGLGFLEKGLILLLMSLPRVKW